MAADRMVLGKGVEYSTDSNETGLNNNVIICASSGAGKTKSLVEPCILRLNESNGVIAVTKRILVNKYKPYYEKQNRIIYDLNLTDPENSPDSFDPLTFVNSYQDITYLAKSVVYSKADPKDTKADPYWQHAAESLLAAEIALAMMTVKNATFADVLKLQARLTIQGDSGAITTSLDSEFERIEQKDPTCFAVTCWRTFKNLPIRTAGCVYSELNTMIDTMFSPDMREMMAKGTTIDFEKMATQKCVLFINTSPVNPALNQFADMVYSQMIKSLFEYAEKQPDGRLPIPMRMFFDDFATGGKIYNFPEYISIFREKQISVMLLLQSESQLAGMYGENHATTIINNCDTYIYMGGMDLQTARSVSDRLNAPLEDVLYMPIGQEFIFRRGQRPIITERYDIYNDELFKMVHHQYERKPHVLPLRRA